MKNLRLLFLILFFALPVFGQGVRFGDQSPIFTAQTPGGVIYSVPNAVISFCNSPANAVPCTNKATTYTSATLMTPCPTSTQIVLAGTTNCVANTDLFGNWGVWVPSGNYNYTITLTNGSSLGPYSVTLSSGGGTPGGSPGQIQFNNSGVFGGFTLAGDCSLSEPTIICTKTNGTAFAASATTNALNASNISTGTLSASLMAAVNLAAAGNGGVSGVLPNSSLAHPSITINSQTCTLGSTCTIPTSTITVNGGAALPPPVNFQNGSAVTGISINFSNPSLGSVQAAIIGTLTDTGLTSAYSGVGACSAHNWASTLNRNAIQTCTQPTLADIAAGVAPTGTFDFSGVSLFKGRVGAALTTTVNGDFGYDTTNKNWHFWENAGDRLAGIWASTPTNGNCVSAQVSSSVVTLIDAGAPCATGTTASWATITAGTNANAGSFLATGNTWDFTGVTLFKGRVGATLTTSANGDFGYDTTNKNWHLWANGADMFLAPLASTPTTGDCAKFTVTASVISLADFGAGCGGTPPALKTNTVNNTSQVIFDATTSTANVVGLTVTPSNPSGGVEKFEVSGASYTGNAATATALASAPTICSATSATYLATGISASGNATGCNPGSFIIVANAGTTGTTTSKLAKLTGAPSTAVLAATTDTGGMVGITISGAGTTSNATIQTAGQVNCVFDGATTAGDYVQVSATTAGDCGDAGATYPSTGQVIGRVLSTNGGAGTYQIDEFDEIQGNPAKVFAGLGDLMYGGANGVPAAVAGKSVNGFYVLGENVTASARVAPNLYLAGVPVNTQSGNYPLVYSDRASFLNFITGSTANLTLPAASGNLASNLPFSVYNGNTGNLTIIPTTPNNINSGTSQAPLVLLPGFADFFYQDSGGTIGWHDMGGGLVTVDALGSTCSTGLNWSTTLGFSCGSGGGGGGVPAQPQYTIPIYTASGVSSTIGTNGTQTDVSGNLHIPGNYYDINGGMAAYVAAGGVVGTSFAMEGQEGTDATCPTGFGGIAGLNSTTHNMDLCRGLKSSAYTTTSNCSSAASPAVCGSAAAGSILIPTGTVSSTLTVNTTAVTANSQIYFVPDDTLGTKLSVTCNSTLATLVGGSAITARTAGTSFQITFNGTIATNGVCGSFFIVN